MKDYMKQLKTQRNTMVNGFKKAIDYVNKEGKHETLDCVNWLEICNDEIKIEVKTGFNGYDFQLFTFKYNDSKKELKLLHITDL
jgi:hypothetical protein